MIFIVQVVYKSGEIRYYHRSNWRQVRSLRRFFAKSSIEFVAKRFGGRLTENGPAWLERFI